MNSYSSVIIGHITMDRNTDHTGAVVEQAGGAVLFSSAAAYAMGHRVAAVTKVAAADLARLDAFPLPKADVFALPSEKSTDMVNVYYTADRERRKSVCGSQGDPFSPAEIPADLRAPIWHLAGLVYGDYADDMIPALCERGDVAVDVQGFLRHVDPADGRMYFEDWAQKKALLPCIRFLKTDAAEAEILTGTADRAAAAKQLYAWGAKEIVITHNTEVLTYDGREIRTCPIRARNLSGRTGRGDTTFAVYINERLTRAPGEALRTAAAAVSLKMETPGPFRGTRADVEAYLESFYPEKKEDR